MDVDDRRDVALWLGSDRASPTEPVELPARALLRHVMALGSSGSGKTVLCKVVVEEAVRSGLPVICIDPQGDLCSLAEGSADPAALQEHGIDPALAAEFRERADVVIFTPGSRKGVPLCADPVDAGLAVLQGAERLSASSRTAAMIVSLLGYEADSDDGAGLAAVFDAALGQLLDAGDAPSLASLSAHLDGLESQGYAALSRYLDPKKIRAACQRLARLDVGARKLLLHNGIPVDIDVLLGRGGGAAATPPGRTRIAVIYLNTLHNQDDKDFFVAAIADRLYSWMLAHPSPEPQALFYIDEVSPFVPPVRKPACKDGLQLLFKQARKYGVCCLMATQNPGDVDYKAMAQFGSWALGRLTTRQDLKKIEPTVKALDPVACDAIMQKLPALRPGEFVLLSPDHFAAAQELRSRWLLGAHETWDDERIERTADGRWRERFAGLERDSVGAAPAAAPPAPAPPAPDPPTPAPPAPDPLAAAHGREPIDTPVPPTLDDPRIAAPAPTEAMPAPPPVQPPQYAAPPVAPPVVAPPPPVDPHAAELARLERVLARRRSMSPADFATAAGVGQKKARALLRELVDAGLADQFKEGRALRYFALSSGARPDLGIRGKLLAAVPAIDRAAAERIAMDAARSRLLGLIGEDEVFERADLVHRLVYKLDFSEKVERPLLGRLVGPSHDERLGSVYIHPHTLALLVFSPRDGVAFVDRPATHASRIQDLDGAAAFVEVAPGELGIDAEDYEKRRPPSDVKKHFKARFAATPGAVTPLFLPLWKLVLRQRSGTGFRVLTVDALAGRPVDWPAPA
jgi:pyruvate/2-oxoglutarate dehydrogenase complex dihydrolipoamide acyltransferase (E2) component